MEESIRESLDFRRAMRKVDEDYGDDWWFRSGAPTTCAPKKGAEPVAADWMLHANEDWHGFGGLAEGFNMLDPIKSTIITPGLDMEGRFASTGIPASVVTKFLVEHGVVVEKTGLYSFFIMFTIGITKGRWNTLLTALQQFKDDYDRNAPLWRILPEFCAAHPKYERMGLRDLCQSIHQAYAEGDIARLTTDMYLSNLQPAMTPTDAYACIAQRRTERVSPSTTWKAASPPACSRPLPAGHPALDPGRGASTARSWTTSSSPAPSTTSSPALRRTCTASCMRWTKPQGGAPTLWIACEIELKRPVGTDFTLSSVAGRWPYCHS